MSTDGNLTGAAATPEIRAGTSQEKGRREGVFHRLYVGTGAFDIIGKRKLWYVFFGLLVAVCIGSIVFRGFNLGIDFEGGTRVQMPAVGVSGQISTKQVGDVFTTTLGKEPSSVQSVGSGESATVQIRSETLDTSQVARLKAALFERFQPTGRDGQPSQQTISDSAVSGSWGNEITRKALIALGVFLVLVTIFLALYFERLMAIAALASLVHDVVVTAGVYSLIGFEVSPATVIGLLTILGFSLYDTVVVFDKIKENTRGPAWADPPNLRRSREPRGQPNPDAFDQHRVDSPAPGDRPARGRCGPARRRHSAGPGAGPTHWHVHRRDVFDSAGCTTVG